MGYELSPDGFRLVLERRGRHDEILAVDDLICSLLAVGYSSAHAVSDYLDPSFTVQDSRHHCYRLPCLFHCSNHVACQDSPRPLPSLKVYGQPLMRGMDVDGPPLILLSSFPNPALLA